MPRVSELFASPEWYPSRMDRTARMMYFVRMTRKNYRDPGFIGDPTGSVLEHGARLDDLLLANASIPSSSRCVHYILHTAFCCSTLLARHLELLPLVFVLKEPYLLAQVALQAHTAARWPEVFDLACRLLTRSFEAGELVVIKCSDCCNFLGDRFLAGNPLATVTFVVGPLRSFVLSALKDDWRRGWLRNRLETSTNDRLTFPALRGVSVTGLDDSEGAAYLWLLNRARCARLSNSAWGSRVLVLDGELVADRPDVALKAVTSRCGVRLEEKQIQEFLESPALRTYSKNTALPYDTNSRYQELAALEQRLAKEADHAVEWVGKRFSDLYLNALGDSAMQHLTEKTLSL